MYKETIIKRVREANNAREYKTYEQCCLAFNRYYSKDIKNGLLKALNKDFLYRVFNTKSFSLSNPRFVKLCEFLKVEMNMTHTPIKISKAALMIDELLKHRPDLEKQINAVVKSMTEVLKGVVIP